MSRQYLQSFIRFAPGGYAAHCAERLRRTAMNGVRGEPPAWLELQVLRRRQHMSAIFIGTMISMKVVPTNVGREVDFFIEWFYAVSTTKTIILLT